MNKIITSGAVALLLVVSSGNKIIAQATVPPAQPLPYTQDFISLVPGTVTTYPSGWQGWQLSTSGSSASFRTTAPTANLTMTASGSASSTIDGVYNFTGRTGFLASSSSDPALCLVVNTSGQSSISVTFDIGTMRNPYNGSAETRRNNVELQYRVGNAVGAFTSLTGSIYRNNTTTQTSGSIPQNSVRYRFLLPAACDGQAAVQLRWVQRDSVGSGNRPSFILDNVIVCAPPTIVATVSPSCSGQRNGSVVLSISGGMAPYTVGWDTINTTAGPTFAVAAIGGPLSYTIDGVSRKELTCVRGVTYSFSGTFPGHPFHISTSSTGGSSANEVTSGTTNNFTQGGMLNFTPNASHPAFVYYQCSVHQNMGAKINIGNGYQTQNLLNAAAGTYTAAISTADGCITAITVTIGSATTPTITVSNNGPRCIGDSTQLSSTGGTSYAWTGPNAFVSSVQNPKIFNANANAGYYKVTVTNSNGCTKKDSTLVSFLALPTVTVSNNGPKCLGDSTQLSASGGTSYAWSGPNGFVSSVQNPKMFNANANAGYYTVVVTNSSGCTRKDSTQVSFLALPTVTVSNNGPLCLGDNTQLSSSGGNSYAWTGPNGFTSSFQNPVLFNASSNAGYYKVVVTNSNGCTKKDSTQVTFLPSPSIVTFAPDSGWAGDTVIISGSGFTGTNAVLFNGISATFVVNNDNQIITIVPSNASTGPISVNLNNGCGTISATNFRPLHYSALYLNIFIEGFYSGNRTMISAIDPTNVSSITDTIIVQLYDPDTLTQPAFPDVIDVIDRTGQGVFIFPENAINNNYYIVVKSRNGIETWSKTPVVFTGITIFDFTQ